MIKKISQDVETMKVDQEHRIEKMEEDVREIKENLNNLVEISRQEMNNSVDGLEKINSMMIDYRTRTIVNDPPLGEKQKKITSDGGQSAAGLGNGSLKSKELKEGGICKDQLQIGDMWQDIQGANNWEGFLDPIDPLLKAEILRYGNFAQHCYDAFCNSRSSQYYGNCKSSKRSLGQRLESVKCGRESNIEATFKPDVRIEKGFLTCYTSIDEGYGRFRLSAREIVVVEMKRLLNNFKDEDVIITFTRHSLGAALATISAYDIKQWR
ncbi:phospholipase A1-Igamma1, chloroplastic-like [Cryptomeria japonica]|uniref:phospholipase A1-Igamma1, chloroplastic-like n=1 Tax=Cryptomeria japonica TaxID=3369 RepID=UPI0027DAB1F3|nr:phospholipase A1-Igamma1, chloroplastic-like [Cryptomeria japonica]